MRVAAPLAAAALLAASIATPRAGAEPLRLVGTVAAPGGGMAAIEDGAGRQTLRRVGEVVAPGLRLVAVRRGAADLVDARGERLVLRLRRGRAAVPGGPRGAAGGPGPAPESAAAAAGPQAAEASVEGPLAAAGASGEAEGPAAAARPRVPPGTRLVPVLNAGRLEGIRLAGGPPDTPLVRAGLMPGDLVVAVDGRPFPDSAPAAIEALLSALPTAEEGRPPIVVDVRRDGLPLRVTLPR